MRIIQKLFVLTGVLGGMLLFTSAAPAATYTIDPVHSTIGFAVKHLGVGTTRGSFDQYSGEITFDPADKTAFNAQVAIEVQSINTKIEKRDDHLRSPDFLDAATYPEISFKSKALLVNGENSYDILGDLTIKDVTKEISVPVTITGPVKGPSGADVIGLAGEITINRKDYNVSFDKTLDNGGLVVDDNVTVIVELEADSK